MKKLLPGLLLATAAGLQAQSADPAPATPVAAPAPTYLRPTLLPALDDAYARVQTWKAEHHLPVSIGAWHWWHADQGEQLEYGAPGSRGTFFYFLTVDPVKVLADQSGPLKSFGAHVEFRFNDGDKFRPSFPSHLWTYDSYLWAYTSAGTFKAGQIWKRFGLDWDDSFWGGTAYFDGLKLNPDWGVAWEHTRYFDARWTLDTYAQFFFHEDGINGAVNYGDSESVPDFGARDTAVLRAVLKHQATEKFRVDLGLSGQAGSIESDRIDIDDQSIRGVAVDATLRYAFRPDLEAKLIAEWLDNRGSLSPYRYVSGGASERVIDTLLGAQLRHGPVTYRAELSSGRDYNPGGEQEITILGVTVAVAKNIDLYIERVRWTVRPDYSAADFIYNDGWEVVLNWRY